MHFILICSLPCHGNTATSQGQSSTTVRTTARPITDQNTNCNTIQPTTSNLTNNYSKTIQSDASSVPACSCCSSTTKEGSLTHSKEISLSLSLSLSVFLFSGFSFSTTKVLFDISIFYVY